MFRSTLAVIGLLGALLFVAKTLSELDESAQQEKSRAALTLQPAVSPTPLPMTNSNSAFAVRPVAAPNIARLEYPILSLQVNEDGDTIGGPSPVPPALPQTSNAQVNNSQINDGQININGRATVKFITTATTRVVGELSRVNDAGRQAQAAAARATAALPPAPTLDWNDALASATPTNTDAQGLQSEQKLTPEMAALRDRIHKVLELYEPRHLNTRDHSPWEVMHSLVGFGHDTQIRRDGPEGELVNAAGWLTWGGRCQGQSLVVLANDHPYAQQGPGVQGHPGQLLAILAQTRIPADYPIKLGGKSFTINDLIEQEKLDCQPNTELTFRLIGLTHYLPSDATWTSRDGEKWSIPRLIREEIKQPIHGASCGGSHRLYGISYAYKTRARRGEPIDGEYARAQKYITDYQRFVLGALQNPDGSLSTDWFDRPGANPDLDRRLQTTGHMLEWLTFSLNDDQLTDPRVVKTVDYLTKIMLDNPQKAWSIGPLGHAVHALVNYDERVFQGRTLGGLQSLGPTKTEAAASATVLRIARQTPGATHVAPLAPASDPNWTKGSATPAPNTLDWTLQNGWSNPSPLGGLAPRPFTP